MIVITGVFVAGAPKTKGSMRVRNRATGAMQESVIGSSRWRVLMASAIKDDIARRGVLSQGRGALGPQPWAGPVSVSIVAHLPPPAGWSFPWPIWARAGDVDKLSRNVLDALASNAKNPAYNGGAIVDDNQVCILHATKHVATPEHPQGVHILVTTP